eukprot:Gb_36716 [translate_table: standard]
MSACPSETTFQIGHFPLPQPPLAHHYSI